ncbi:hypothetical protein SAMD00019534_017460 [Acytostelium subglobosum LB1]|uniref:hypothetical protein n=1 Tax=Acytostelium subglobosum LB1 TaxID=1410327 RepID=UPI000644AD40|nr:hypothetical protein SAMD00019534_017460 [Acytostelium subglobosum LB1]GAM18571.1 hypothetical protein SAMD00019534_017460 [Acytostelium subglobosum LB1]|eukprot:XP_012757791.1 hypothetical protein SAMD00019534_017460 [Acytostelium subglobosum LB1]
MVSINRILCCTLIIASCFALYTSAQYQPNWESINSRPLPEWYDEIKFGIFIHWGTFSVPAFGNGTTAEWYWYYLNTRDDGGYVSQYHNSSFGPEFTYQSFAPMFTAHLYDPDQWADLFVRAGAKYVVLTTKHHEGFTNWPSAQAWGYNAVDVGPHMDLVDKFANSIKKAGLRVGLYFSLFEWYNPLYIADANSGSPPTTDVYVQDVMMPQLYDLINSYEPDLLWTDGDWLQPSSYFHSVDFISWLYNDSAVKDHVIINDRWGSETRGVDGGFFTDEQFTPGHLSDHKWESCMTIGYSWGYNQYEDAGNYQTSTSLIQTLIETVACGGNLLLNVGPTKEGIIPIIMQTRLLEIGAWLNVNGEAIYGSKPWRAQNDTADIWYTWNTTTTNVYAMSYSWPIDSTLVLPTPVGSSETKITLLGYDEPMSFSHDSKGGITIKLPQLTPSQYPTPPYTFKLENVK